MPTLTLEFHPGPPIRLQARSTLTGDAADNFSPALSGEALSAALQALEPGFDPQRIESAGVVDTLQSAGLPLGAELLSAVGDGLGQSLQRCPKVFRAFETNLATARSERRPLRLELRFAPTTLACLQRVCPGPSTRVGSADGGFADLSGAEQTQGTRIRAAI